MLVVGENVYPLCLLDTMAVSDMLDDRRDTFRNFYAWAMNVQPCFVPCFSPFTFIELRRRPDLFRRFTDVFEPLPCVMLKGYEQFLEEEAQLYPDPSSLDPCAIAFTPLGGDGNRLRNLPSIMETPSIKRQEAGWNNVRRDIAEGMVSLVPNYPADGDKYTDAELRAFIQQAGWSQLALRAGAFMKQVLDSGSAVNIDVFPSLKAMLYTTFYKFYVDAPRKPADSDAFDIIISAAVPYVEAIFTENHQAEALRKTKRRDAFIEELQIFSLRDFRDEPPS